MKADPDTQIEINAVLDRFRLGYSAKDVGLLLSLFAPDPDVLVIGAGEDEKRTGIEEIQRQFEEDFNLSESLIIQFENVTISQMNTVCWVAGDIHLNFTVQGQAMHNYLRFTGVLENRNGKWLFVQTHFSLPYVEKEG